MAAALGLRFGWRMGARAELGHNQRSIIVEVDGIDVGRNLMSNAGATYTYHFYVTRDSRYNDAPLTPLTLQVFQDVHAFRVV